MKIDFGNNLFITQYGFFQYDFGQTLTIYNVGSTEEYLNFQFIQGSNQINKLGTYDATDDSYSVSVPDTLLQNSSDMMCYVYYNTETVGYTMKAITFKITARSMYSEIPDPSTQSLLGEVLDKLEELEYKIDHLELTEEQLQSILEQVETALGDVYYTKTDINSKLSGYATTSITDELSTQVSNLSDLVGQANTILNEEL